MPAATPPLASWWQPQPAVKGQALDRALGRLPLRASVRGVQLPDGRTYQPSSIQLYVHAALLELPSFRTAA